MITASIVVYKSDKSEFAHVLRCVCESSVDKIYVVDNSPTDQLRVDMPKVEYIWGQGNVGYGSAHNIVIRKSIASNASYHVVVNPDIYFEKGTIESLAQYMDKNEDVGQVMPKVIYPNGDIQYLCKLMPTPMDLIGRRFFPSESRNYRFEMRSSDYNTEMEVPFLSGCFMFLRVEAVEKIGGFDDHFFMYCEDIDLCRRIGMAGYRTMYYPEVTVVHAHKKESFKSNKMLLVHIKSAVRYFCKWGWIFDTYRRKVNNSTIAKLGRQ